MKNNSCQRCPRPLCICVRVRVRVREKNNYPQKAWCCSSNLWKRKIDVVLCWFYERQFQKKGKDMPVHPNNKQTNKQTRLIPHFQERKEKKKLAND
mmetsp:Transcript_9977/g.24107  ORF Transcript_9977/g.24107 Transcript_9977/m.24107 type:complete len:96 (+) Transcript_9977:1036-1323(+)